MFNDNAKIVGKDLVYADTVLHFFFIIRLHDLVGIYLAIISRHVRTANACIGHCEFVVDEY